MKTLANRFPQLTPQLLKSAVVPALLELLAPIQAAFQASEEWQKIEKQAYPPPPEKKKKEKKDKGSRHPGAAKAANGAVEAKPDGSVTGQGSAEVSVGKTVDEALEKLDLEKKAMA